MTPDPFLSLSPPADEDAAPLPTVILVVPCYNEAGRLDVAAFQDFARRNSNVSFLFVDDGSRDRTWSVLQRLREGNPRQVTIRRLPHNRGKAEAVREGMREALRLRPVLVGYWDADLATPLSELARFLHEARVRPWAEVLMGSRVPLLGRTIERTGLRHALGRLFAAAASRALNLSVYDTQCGAKIFRNTPDLERVLERPFTSRWIFDVEVLARFLEQGTHRVKRRGLGSSVAEVPLAQWIEKDGSKVKPMDFVNSFFELFRIGRFHRRTLKAARHTRGPAPAPPAEIGFDRRAAPRERARAAAALTSANDES